MAQNYILPNGEMVPVPREISSQGVAAEQAFFDLQLERLKAETAPAAPAGSNA